MIVLDTHVLIWWVAGSKKIPTVTKQLLDAEASSAGEVHVSTISAWEIAMLVRAGRLELTLDVSDWIAKCEAAPFIRFVPVDNRIALRSLELPSFPHWDPADRIIVATALTLGASLVTSDTRLGSYEYVNTIWN